MLAATKLLGSIRVLVRQPPERLAEKLHAQKGEGPLLPSRRALPGPMPWPLSSVFGNDF
jgi:hypothetical protein